MITICGGMAALSGTATTYTDMGLESRQTYSHRARASNAAGRLAVLEYGARSDDSHG